MSFAGVLLGAGLSLAGGFMGAAGAKASAEATARAAEANAQISEVRAAEAERNRGIALDKAAMEVRDSRVKSRAVMGQVRAAYGASGLAMDGSPLDVIAATAGEQELDVEKILYRGDLEGVALTDQANSFRAQAQVYRMGGQAAITAGGYSMAANILSGFGGAVKSFTGSRYAGDGSGTVY